MAAKKTGTRIALGSLAIVALIGCCVLAVYVSGVVFFLMHKASPKQARFDTIFAAAQVAETKKEKNRVKGAALIAALLCVGGPIGLVIAAVRRRPASLHGDARFATVPEVEKEGLFAPKGIILGRFANRVMRLPGFEFVSLIAPTRTGKGVSVVIPNLLEYPDSAVVLDIKGENFALTASYRQKKLGNKVFYFNPFSEHSHGWNMLSYVSRDERERVKDLMGLAKIIWPDNPKEPFWPNAAQDLFVALGLLLLETPGLPTTVGEMMRQIGGKGEDPTKYLRGVIADRAEAGVPLSDECVDALNRVLNNSENTLKSVMATFTSALTIFTSAITDKATDHDDFDLSDVRKKRMSIYVHIPANEIVQSRFILNVFFSQLFGINTRELPEQNPLLRYGCMLMLDEFTAIGKIESFAKGVGYFAGYNLRVVMVIQDRSQLVSSYGKEDAEAILSNMGAVIVFTPGKIEDAEQFSKQIGNQTVRVRTRQRSSNMGGTGTGSTGSRTESESEQKRAVMLPQELTQMDKTDLLVFRSGMQAVRAKKITYYADPDFAQRFTSVEMRTAVVGGASRQVPSTPPLPAPLWDFYWIRKARTDYYVTRSYRDLTAPNGRRSSSFLDEEPPSMLEEATAELDQALQDGREEAIQKAMEDLIAAQFDSMVDGLLSGESMGLRAPAFPSLSSANADHAQAVT